MTVEVSPSPTSAPTAAMPVCSPSPEFLDGYEYGKDDDSTVMDDTASKDTVWHVLSTIYIPILLVRLRRSLFGVANVIRSLCLGQCLRVLITYLMPASWEQTPWFQSLLGTTASKAVQTAWPPPTLIALAVLTVLAFVVHPDGMTWILMGKLRDGIMTLLHSSATCWNVMIDDYGILSTLAAATTFAALICLVVILHKTLTPKTPKTSMPERKKKKRKGHARNTRGKIKGKNSKNDSPQRKAAAPLVQEEAKTTCCDSQMPKVLPKETTARAAVEPPVRPRGQSHSTVDTVATMDDQSCASSVASAPSASATTVSHSTTSPSTNDGRRASRHSNRKRANTKRSRKAMTKPTERVSTAVPTRSASSFIPPPTPSPRPKSRQTGNETGRFTRPLVSSSLPAPNTKPSESLFSSPTHNKATTGPPPGMPLASSSLFSHDPIASSVPSTPTTRFYDEVKTPPRSVDANQYAGNYASSYSRGGAKNELATLLAQAGLVGTTCADLLEALDDITALSRLSDAQFELYNVTPDKMERIKLLLEARQRARATPIRPPPGLSPGVDYGTDFMSPPRLGTSPAVISPGYPSQFTPSGHSGIQLPSLSVLNDEEEDNSRIEAELQELGGQMVGSILD